MSVRKKLVEAQLGMLAPAQRVPAFHCAAVGRFPSYSAIPCSRKFRL